MNTGRQCGKTITQFTAVCAKEGIPVPSHGNVIVDYKRSLGAFYGSVIVYTEFLNGPEATYLGIWFEEEKDLFEYCDKHDIIIV
jgi:hypothetical protein